MYIINNKIHVNFSVFLWEPHSCVRNSVTYFGNFIKGMAAQLGPSRLI